MATVDPVDLEALVVEAVERDFALPSCAIAQRFGGNNKANLRLTIAGRADVVARVYPPTTSLARVRAIQHARIALSDAGLPYVRPLPTPSGDTLTTLPGDRALELEEFRPGEDMNSLEEIVLAMPLLGRTHSVLARHPSSYAGRYAPTANHVAGYAIRSLATQLVARSAGWSDDLAHLARRTQELAEAVAAAEAPLAPGHEQLVHGDFWNNNVLFVDGRVSVVLDLDFMGFRPRTDDLALTLYYTRSDYLGLFDHSERLRWIARIVNAYDSGLDEPLTDEERHALPFALARTILYGMRYIAASSDEVAVQKRVRGDAPDVDWSLDLVRSPEPWHEAMR